MVAAWRLATSPSMRALLRKNDWAFPHGEAQLGETGLEGVMLMRNSELEAEKLNRNLIMHRITDVSCWSSLLLFLIFGTLSALAHSKMNSSIPADGASVAAGLEQIEFSFSDPLRLTLVKVKSDDSQTIAAFTPANLPKTAERKAVLDVSSLGPGRYTVVWTGIGEDGHVMNGSFAFTVNPK